MGRIKFKMKGTWKKNYSDIPINVNEIKDWFLFIIFLTDFARYIAHNVTVNFFLLFFWYQPFLI